MSETMTVEPQVEEARAPKRLYFPTMGEEPPIKKRNTNPKVKKYVCDYEGCENRYNRPSLLKEHQRTHSGERPFKCDQCDDSFFRQSHLKAHMLKHVPAEEKPFRCEMCGKGMNNAQHLKNHVRTHFATFECEECPAKFHKHGHLRKHINAEHSNKTPFECEHCGKGYKHKKRYETHVMNNHSENPNYHCGEEGCNEKFFQWNKLQHHVRTEHKKTPCDICGKRCVGPVGLAQHMKVHEDDDLKRYFHCMEFKCEHLSQSRDLLVSHYRSVHGFIPRELKKPLEGYEKTPKDESSSSSPCKSKSESGRLTEQGDIIQRLTGFGYEDSGRPIACPYEDCEWRFARDYDLRRHKAAVHKERQDKSSDDDADDVNVEHVVFDDAQLDAALESMSAAGLSGRLLDPELSTF